MLGWPQKKGEDYAAQYTYNSGHDGLIGKGKFREALTATRNSDGEKFVCKRPLDKNDSILSQEKTVDMVVDQYKYVGKLAQEWNKTCAGEGSCGTIDVVDSWTVKNGKIVNNKFIHDGIYYLYEKYIPGKFSKFNCNLGRLKPGKCEKHWIQCFSHFVYHKTRGQMMVLDIQGVYDEDKNHFTISDPVLVSSTPMGGVFGPTDFGNAAINLFFLNYSSQWHSVSKTWYKDTIGLVSDISAKSMVHKKSKTKELSSSQSSSAQILRITAKNTMIYLKQIDNFLSDLEYLDGNLFNSTIENFAEQIREIKENAPKSVFQSCQKELQEHKDVSSALSVVSEKISQQDMDWFDEIESMDG